ncbi:acyl carrier protein [Pontibacter liquoris]|uniref:acyl carrier protein n=1 Tax=Pontibacter liquoris TaxID=2905677 RepID=UPI001FA7D839|nr:acyl carrier protein [Pontibacter liquoris]
MGTLRMNPLAIKNEVLHIITSLKKVHPNRLKKAKDLDELGFDNLDVVDIILALEKTYQLTIPDEVPVYKVDDFVNYIYSHSTKR